MNLRDRKLERRIREACPFLFEDYGGTVVLNRYYFWSFGNAVIVIRTGNVLLRVVRDRGQSSLELAPADRDSEFEWRDFEFVSRVFRGEKNIVLRWTPPRSLEEIAPELKALLPTIIDSYIPEHYEKTKALIDSAIRS